MRRSWIIWLISGGVALAVAGVALPALLSHLDGTAAAQRRKAEVDLGSFAVLVQKFYALNHRYPRNDEGLSAALRLGVGMDQVRDRHPLDPWGRPYVYRARANEPPQLYSLGPNGIDEHGEGDDISAGLK
jgi:type II secretory pathway pseudopilin PulG